MAVTARSHTFLRAARRETVDHTPVWFMRQAGRYMPEYRRIRERHTLLEICAAPALACEVTLQPIRAFEVDAAILFADILLPLVPMGLDLSFAPGEGPVIANPIRSVQDVERLRTVDVQETLGHVLETIRLVRRELNDRIPLIGFAGAPFTVASYAIEGGSSRNFVETKTLMYGAPNVWHRLMEHFTGVLGDYLAAQIEAGAQAVQLFDSWVGALSASDYRAAAAPYTRRIIERLASYEVPVIHFGVNTSHMLEDIREAGGDVVGVDWRIPLGEAWQRIGFDRGIQGNLDPVVLFAQEGELTRRVHDVMEQAASRPGHIFNLGHGILPGTPVDRVRAVVDLVHEYTPRP